MNGQVWPLHRVQEGEVHVQQKKKKRSSSSTLSLERNREPWKVIGSGMFLKALLLLEKR